MTEWVYPKGSAQQGEWDISLGGFDSQTKAPGWQHTGLKVATLTAGDAVQIPGASEERLVIPLAGSFTVQLAGGDGVQKFDLTGRDSVFAGRTDVVYAGIWTSLTISSDDGGRVAIASAPATETFPAEYLAAEDIPVELRGAGNCSRQVHNFGTPATLSADRFIVCEVLTPAGNWSSYPPHKHDEEKAGESSLEEIYYFETQPVQGAPAGTDTVGYQRVYASDERPIDVTAEVRSGDVVMVPYGWHGPAMAAPGYDLYYLNVMAGPGAKREWLISDDPHHGWLRSSWATQELDPRLPFGR